MPPQFVKYMRPVSDALKELGNSGTPSEVFGIIAKNLNLNEKILDQQLPSGSSRYENQVQWAKFYLSKAGHIDSSKRGIWSLTDKGIQTNLTEKDAIKIFSEIHKKFVAKNRAKTKEIAEDVIAPTEATPVIVDSRVRLLEIIRSLPPTGFERLCQRLLREAGFQKVTVTGRSGDGGIDGKGLLQINPLVSITVVFQSKRYKAERLVDVSQVRDLRGAIEGRAEKGILITTSGFTSAAKDEAQREGASLVELVDGESLVNMFEKLELGLRPKTIFEIDEDFFDEFERAK